jgi:hypothetical protein
MNMKAIFFAGLFSLLLIMSSAHAWYSENGVNYGRRTIITINATLDGWMDFTENVTYNTNMTATFNDIRYMGPDGTILPYCIYKNVTSSWAYIFVNVSNTVKNQNISIYRYYNYTNATSQENCTNAMGFLNDKYHSNSWTNGAGNLTVDPVNNSITVSSVAGAPAYAYVNMKAYGNNTRFEFMVKNIGTTGNEWDFVFADKAGYGASVNGYDMYGDGQAATNFNMERTTTGDRVIDTAWTPDTLWHNITILKNSTGEFNLWFDTTSYGTGSDNTYNTYNYLTLLEGRTANFTINNISAYKFSGTNIIWSKIDDASYTSDSLSGCASGNPLILYIQSLDEINSTYPITGTMNGYITAVPTGGGAIETYNFTSNTQNISLCRGLGIIYLSGNIQYSATGYSTRYYNFQNYISSTSSPLGINLYLLNNGNSTTATFVVKDQFSNAVSGLILDIERYYPETNTFRIVSAPMTNSNGMSTTYITPDSVQYQFQMYKDGTLIYTIPADTVSSYLLAQGPVALLMGSSTINILPYLQDYVTTTVTNDTQGNITAYYNDQTGFLSNMTLTVSRVSSLANTVVCSITNITTPSGYIICKTGGPLTTGLYSYTLQGGMSTTLNNMVYVFQSGSFDYGATNTKLFGECSDIANQAGCQEGVFITLMFVIACIMIGIVSPVASIVMMMFGLWITMQIGLFAMTFDVFIGLLLVAGIVIWRIRQ